MMVALRPAMKICPTRELMISRPRYLLPRMAENILPRETFSRFSLVRGAS